MAQFPPLLVQLLHNRGISRPEDFAAFLASDASLLGDPLLLPDMPAAVARVYRALLAGETIGVYGDFDADGITATAVLAQGLARLGAKVVPYIPHRQTEGHGLTAGVLKKLHEAGRQPGHHRRLRRHGRRRGQESQADGAGPDHHRPPQPPRRAAGGRRRRRPQAGGVFLPVSPVRRGRGGLQAAPGVYAAAWAGKKSLDCLTDLAAIGTIADMSPPLGENRYLIKAGLKNLNENPRPGLKELISQTRLEPGGLDADHIGWVIAPCLNAAGRLADGLTGYRLLMTESPQEAAELAQWLAKKNEERQRLTTTTLAKAREQVVARGLPPLLLTADKDYPMGIAGLVASRLTEEFYRPSIVIHTADEVSHASCRSIPEFDIIAALQ